MTGESTKLYQIKESAGRGLGVFANVAIKRGTRIMSEEPLISLKPGESGGDVPAKFLELAQDQKVLFLNLHRARTERDAPRETALRSNQISGTHGSAFHPYFVGRSWT